MRLSAFATSAALASLAIAGVMMSCQGRQPVSTEEATSGQGRVLTPPEPMVTSIASDGSTISMQGGFAYAELTLTDADGQVMVELEPARTAEAGGDAYLVDVTRFFTESPCRDCLAIESVKRGSGFTGVEVEIRAAHPFAAPILPTARRDLHVFDVMGVVLSNGEPGQVLAFDPDSILVYTGNDLRNADGYTSLLDSALDTWLPTPGVEAHPYRIFSTDSTPGTYDPLSANGLTDLVAPTGRNIFPMGGSSTIPFQFNLLPGETRRVGLALLASYGQSASNRAMRTTPQYYLPEFNHKPAWKVAATLQNNNLIEGQTGSTAELVVAVRDWQEGATVAGAWEFGTTAKDQVRQASEVASVTVALPGVLTAPSTQTGAGTGTGVFDDMTYTFLLTNQAGAGIGTFPGLVTVTDTLLDSRSSGLDRDLTPTDLGQFTTYQLFFAEVQPNPNNPPTLTCNLTCLPNPPNVGGISNLSIDAASDPDGPAPLEYEWDFSFQGNATDFSPPDAVTASPTTTFTFPDTTPRTIGVRARDGLGAASAACSAPFTAVTGLVCADAPQFQVQNTGNFTRVYMNHELSGYGGNPSMGWQQHIAFSPVSQDVYLLVSGLEVGQSFGGNYVMRSSDGGCTWGSPVLTATRNCPCPPYDGWTSTGPVYPSTISCTADGHPVLTWMEGICWTRYAYGTNAGPNSTTWSAPQTAFVEDWGSYWEWTHQILADPIDPNRVTIAWRGVKQAAEPASYGSNLGGMVRMAFTTNANGAPALWQTRVLVNVNDGGGASKWRTYASLGSTATGDQQDVFVTWIVNGSPNLYAVKWESSTDLASTAVVANSGPGVPLDPVIVVDNANNPILLYDGTGTGNDIFAKKGVDGFPPTFPSPAVVVNSGFAAGSQRFVRAAHDAATGRTFVAIQDDNTITPQIRLVTLDSSLAVTSTVKVNTNDATDNTYRHVNPQIGWESPYLYVTWQDSQYTWSSPTTVEQFRPGLRILTQ